MHVHEWQKAMQSFYENTDTRLKNQKSAIKLLLNRNKGGGKYRENANNRSGGRYRKRKNTSKYCWIHGACAHDSRSCSNKKEGHQDGATFSNKLGGSTASNATIRMVGEVSNKVKIAKYQHNGQHQGCNQEKRVYKLHLSII